MPPTITSNNSHISVLFSIINKQTDITHNFLRVLWHLTQLNILPPRRLCVQLLHWWRHQVHGCVASMQSQMPPRFISRTLQRVVLDRWEYKTLFLEGAMIEHGRVLCNIRVIRVIRTAFLWWHDESTRRAIRLIWIHDEALRLSVYNITSRPLLVLPLAKWSIDMATPRWLGGGSVRTWCNARKLRDV